MTKINHQKLQELQNTAQ